MSIRSVKAGDGGPCTPKKGVIYCVRSRHADGRAVHKHFDFRDEARLFEKRLQAEHVGGATVQRDSQTTFQHASEEWLSAHTWKDNTTPRYALKRAYPILGAKPLARITGLDVQRLQTKLLSSTARASTELTMHFVKRVLRQAHRDHLIGTDPTIGVRMPRRDSLDTDGVVTPIDVPTHAEAAAIVESAPDAYRAGVVLGMACGLRVGEVLGLTPAKVNPAGMITIDQQLQRRGLDSPKTWRGVRTIGVPAVVSDELAKAVIGLAPNEPILSGSRGGVLRRDGFYEAAWRPALIGAGLAPDRYKFHSARHYTVSNLLEEGVPLVEVAAYVGDAPETISRVYAHVLRDARPQARAALDRVWTRDKSATSADG